MDHINKLSTYTSWFIPIILFIIGLAGSVHCISMCGGLVGASATSFKSNLVYQVFRLCGYMIMSSLLFFFGKVVVLNNLPMLSQVGEYVIGAVFIFIGIKILLQRKMTLKAPSFLTNLSQKVLIKGVVKKNVYLKSAFVGFFSVLLPCGYLYTVLFGLIGLNNFTLSILALFGFWLGTLPGLLFGVNFFKRIINTKFIHRPVLVASLFFAMGIFTFTHRFGHRSINSSTSIHLEKENCH